jgi:hypothetical protein
LHDFLNDLFFALYHFFFLLLSSGGNAYTVLIDHNKNPPTWNIATVIAQNVQVLVDITQYVNKGSNDIQGTIWPGGTAYCAASDTMWVGIDAAGGDKDTFLTVDLKGKKVTAIDLNMPVLGAHFADCRGAAPGKPGQPGGVMVASAGFNRHSVVIGTITVDGDFAPVDAADLPAAGNFDMAPIADAISPFSDSYGAILYSKTAFTLPGLLFSSTPAGGRGSAVLGPINEVIVAIALLY